MLAPFVDPLEIVHGGSDVLPLLGREVEMQQLRVLLHAVLRGEGGPRAVTISGETGIGKSRLLAEFYADARKAGFRLLEGRVYEAARMFPYFPFIELLRPVIRTTDIHVLKRYMGMASVAPALVHAGPASSLQQDEGALLSLPASPLVSALSRIFPELPARLNIQVVHEVLSPELEKFRLFDAIATLLERIALEQPLVLGIDNIQWADSASLELMMYLTVRLQHGRVLLIGATRPPQLGEGSAGIYATQEEQGAAALAAARALSELMSQGLLLLLPLGTLEHSSIERHIHALLPGGLPEHVVAMLLERAEGNPFFLEELVRTLVLQRQLVQGEQGWRAAQDLQKVLPRSIVLSVQQRLHEISPACRALLGSAAVCGRTFALEVLARVQEQSANEAQIQDMLHEAERSGLIAPLPDARHAISDISFSSGHELLASFEQSYLFCQGIVHEVLTTELPSHKLAALHKELVGVLEAFYGIDAQAHAAELAHHALLGNDKAAALRWSLLAGEDAVGKQAYREAIAHFRLALNLKQAGYDTSAAPSPVQLALTLGTLSYRVGALEQATQIFEQLATQLQQSVKDDALYLAQVHRYLADIYRLQTNYDQAFEHLQIVQRVLGDEGVAETQEHEVGWTPPRQLVVQTRTLEQANATEHLLFLQARGTLDILLNRPEEAEQTLVQVRQLAREQQDRGAEAFALHFMGYLRGWGKQIHEALSLTEQALTLYLQLGDPFHAVLSEQVLGIIYQALGEIESATFYNRRGLERVQRYGLRYIVGWFYWNSSISDLTRGDWTQCAQHLEEAWREAQSTPAAARLIPVLLQTRAELAFRRGAWQQAEADFQEGIRLAMQTEWYPSSLALYGHFLAVTGRNASARTYLDKAAEFTEPLGYAGDYYIPFLAEGYLHIDAPEQAMHYSERLREQRGFLYYGTAVDRIVGIVATQRRDWQEAEQAFEAALALCQRTHNEPEEAAILYEQARTLLLQSAEETGELQQRHMLTIQRLCDKARLLFSRYGMERSAELVATFQVGVQQLERRRVEAVEASEKSVERKAGGRELLEPELTKREMEVLRLVAEGHTDKEVADALIISHRTVHRHLSNIFVKLDVPGRAAAVAYAIRQSLV